MLVAYQLFFLQMYFTPKLKAMLGLLITALVFRRVLMIDNSINYHVCMYEAVTLSFSLAMHYMQFIFTITDKNSYST
jgi:hypothetical protein